MKQEFWLAWRRPLTRHVKNLALRRAGYKCSFPGCSAPAQTDEGAIVLETAHIVPKYLGDDLDEDNLDNFIVLCPAHHRLVDFSADKYAPDVLRKMRADHEAAVGRRHAAGGVAPTGPTLPKSSRLSFEEALNFWDKNKTCDSEDVWHEFFVTNAHILALAMPGNVLQLGNKCFVGGKDIFNRNGSVVDFIYVPTSYQGVTLFEIKTPQTRLVGSEYRNRCFPPSPDLAGSVVQALHYKRLAYRHLDDLVRELNPRPSSIVVHAAVVVGNRNSLDHNKKDSFELFVAGLRDVQVVTYDDIFAKVKAVLEL